MLSQKFKWTGRLLIAGGKIMEELIAKIENENAEIGIIGLGYTGLPLAIAFSKKFHVVGYDVNKNNVSALLKGESGIKDVKNEELKINNYLWGLI